MAQSEFDIDAFYEFDADDIITAQKRSKRLHKTKNISTAGDQVERTIRNILQRRLPSHYYISQGHIVDNQLKSSGQFDVIISDNKISPLLFTASNGTDYLTYESIYGVGEIKSTFYSNEKPIEKFKEKIQAVNNELKRDKSTSEYLTSNIRLLANEGLKIFSSDIREYKNPLFKFIFFVSSGDFDFEKHITELNNCNDVDLPNIICFLDKGFIVNSEVLVKEYHTNVNIDFSKGPEAIKAQIFGEDLLKDALQNSKFETGDIELYPEFIKAVERNKYKWVFFNFEEIKTRASVLSFLIFTLNQHIGSSILLKPDLKEYHKRMFKSTAQNIAGS